MEPPNTTLWISRLWRGPMNTYEAQKCTMATPSTRVTLYSLTCASHSIRRRMATVIA